MPILDNHKSNPLNINLRETNLGSPVIINDKSIQKIGFNVMADKKVEELLYIKEYRVWDNAIETIFDREYYTEMEASPDHLIFLSALVALIFWSILSLIYGYDNKRKLPFGTFLSILVEKK